MPVWSGFGVNYKGPQSDWDRFIAYSKAIGMKYVRPNMFAIPLPWSNATPDPNGSTAAKSAFWRMCAVYLHNGGLWVTWGPTHNGTLTASSWQAYHDAVISEATYLVQNNMIVDEFEVGNELEGNGSINIIVGSITQSGGVATCTTTQNHNFQTGESVTVYGSTPAGYNGTFTVTVTGAKTFTYAVDSGLTSPASAVGYCYSISAPQLNANIRQLALDIKAISGWTQTGMLVSYGCFNKNLNGVNTYDDWIANGLGGLDTISIHPYGNINPNTQTVANGGFNYIAEMVAAFGNKCYISEFNLDSGSVNLASEPTSLEASQMVNLWNIIKSSGVSKALIYEFSPYLGNTPADVPFSEVYTNEVINPTWLDFFVSQPMLYASRSTSIINRANVPDRSVIANRIDVPNRILIFS